MIRDDKGVYMGFEALGMPSAYVECGVRFATGESQGSWMACSWLPFARMRCLSALNCSSKDKPLVAVQDKLHIFRNSQCFQ